MTTEVTKRWGFVYPGRLRLYDCRHSLLKSQALRPELSLDRRGPVCVLLARVALGHGDIQTGMHITSRTHGTVELSSYQLAGKYLYLLRNVQAAVLK